MGTNKGNHLIVFSSKSVFDLSSINGVDLNVSNYEKSKVLLFKNAKVVGAVPNEIERIDKYDSISFRNEMMSRIEQLLERLPKNSDAHFLIDVFRYEVLLRSGLFLQIFSVYKKIKDSGINFKLILDLEDKEKLRAKKMFGKLCEISILNAPYTQYSTGLGLKRDIDRVIKSKRKRVELNFDKIQFLFVEVFSKNYKFINFLIKECRDKDFEHLIVYPDSNKELPLKAVSLSSLTNRFEKINIFLSLFRRKLHSFLESPQDLEVFLKNCIFQTHHTFLFDIYCVKKRVLTKRVNFSSSAKKTKLITTSISSPFVRAFLYEESNYEKRILVQHGIFNGSEFEKYYLHDEVWVWGKLFENSLKKLEIEPKLKVLGYPITKSFQEVESSKSRKSITYFPSTVNGSTISLDQSIRIAKELNFLPQSLVDYQWKVKYKNNSDKELLQPHLSCFEEVEDFRQTLNSTHIVIITTSTVGIEALVYGRFVAVYHPKDSFEGLSLKYYKSIPEVAIAKTSEELQNTIERYSKIELPGKERRAELQSLFFERTGKNAQSRMIEELFYL